MEKKLRTKVDIKCFKESVKFVHEFKVGDEGRYVYQVSHQNINYILKGFRIQLEHLNISKEKSKEFFMQNLVEISEVFQEYYFAKAASKISSHVTAPLCLDFAIEFAKDETSYSYIYIEIIFEYGGTALSSLQSITLESIYNLMRQSANALFILHNLGIAHFDIKPANMVYDNKNDLLKVIDMGSAFGSSKRKKLSATTKRLDGKVRTATPEYAPPEMLNMDIDQSKNPESDFSLTGIDVYCWAMSFFAMLTKRRNDELAADTKSHRSGSEIEYKDFVNIVERQLNSVDPKTPKEKDLKDIIKSLLTKALNFIPKERPTIKDIINEMRKFERKKKHYLKYLEEEANHNENLMKLFVSYDTVKLTCDHEVSKDYLVKYVLELFVKKKEYNYSCFCLSCQKVQKLKSLPLDCGCVWTQFGTKIKLDNSNKGKCIENEDLNYIDLGLVNGFMSLNPTVQMIVDHPEEKKNLTLAGLPNKASAKDLIKIPKAVKQFDFGKSEKKEAEGRDFNRVTKLDLSFKNLEGENINIVIEEIKANPALEEFNLWRNKIRDKGAKVIAEELKSNLTIKRLNLSNNEIGDGGAKAIGEMLRTNNKFIELSLSHNEIKGEGARVICEALKGNDTLSNLRIDNNKIGNEGAKAFSELLKIHKKIVELDLRLNDIGDEGAKAIADALKTNTTLKKLYITEQTIEAEGKKALEEAQKKNKQLSIKYS